MVFTLQGKLVAFAIRQHSFLIRVNSRSIIRSLFALISVHQIGISSFCLKIERLVFAVVVSILIIISSSKG